MSSQAGLNYRLSLDQQRKEPKAGDSLTGKTTLIENFCDIMFGNPKAHVRINCSEYADDHQVNRMIGAPQGFVGFKDEDKGETDKRNPYMQEKLDKHHTEHLKMTVVLLDEIEKAHPDFYKYHLNIFEDGEAQDLVSPSCHAQNSLARASDDSAVLSALWGGF